MSNPAWRAETKQCARCGATFGPRLRETLAHWATHRYCSPACYHAARRPTDAHATCAQCGTSLRTTDRGQRFCSRACVQQWQREERARQRGEMRDD